MPEINMANQPITKEKLINADIDVENLGKAVNEKGVVNPRYGEIYPTLPSAIQIVIESGGFEPFATEAQLKASTPVLTKKAAYALNTHKIWLWSNNQWVDTGLSAIDQAKADSKIKADAALDEAKAYADSSARFKDQEIAAETDLNTIITPGSYVCRTNSTASLELNYPDTVAGNLTVSRYRSDAAVYQEYLTTGGRKYMRARTGSTWTTWQKQANIVEVNNIIQPVSLNTGNNLNDLITTGKYIARFDTTASFEMNYPVKAPGVLDVVNNPGDSTVFQTFETLNNVVYKRTFTANEWSQWGVLNELDSAFYQLFASDLVAYNFSDLKCFVPAKINSSLRRVYAAKGSDYLAPFAADADAIAKYSNGKISLTGRSKSNNNRLTTSKPLLKIGSTLAFTFKYTSIEKQMNIIWQHAAGVAGRMQMSINSIYTGSALTMQANSFQIFLNGVTDGGGRDGNIKNKVLASDTVYRVVLVIGEGIKQSKLYINNEFIDEFTVTDIANVNTQVLGFNQGSTYGVELGKLIAIQQVLNESELDEVDFWLGKFDSFAPGHDDSILNNLNLISSKTACAAIVPQDGIYKPELLLYLQNETHIGLQASLTKVITSIVLLDNVSNLNEVITRTSEDAITGSGGNLSVGDSITLYSALRNLMLSSSNVTAKIIARVYGGRMLQAAGITEFTTADAIARWVTEINVKAQQIGMKDTIFGSPDGLDTDTSSPAKITALDCLKMVCYATRYDALMDAWSVANYAMPVATGAGGMKTVNITTTVIPLLEGDDYVYGGKTGTLNRYGYNVVEVAVMPDGRKVALLILGASSGVDRAADIRTVMNAVATKYNWSSLPKKTA